MKVKDLVQLLSILPQEIEVKAWQIFGQDDLQTVDLQLDLSFIKVHEAMPAGTTPFVAFERNDGKPLGFFND